MAEPRIEISIDGNTFQLEKKLKDSVGTASKSGDRAGKTYGKNFSDGIKNIAIGNIIADATRSAVRLFSNEIRQGVSSLRSLSAATAEANSILGTNEKITRDVANQFRQFSEQFGTGQQRQVKAFYGIVSGGIQDTTKRLDVLETANTAAVAGLVDINTAATALVSSVNAYSSAGLTAEQASDQLFTAVRLGQTTFGELASTVGRVAPIASSLGVSFDELTGSIAGVTTGGIATAEAVTGLRAIFNGIVKPTNEAREAAERFGIELGANAIKNVGGFANFLEILIQKTGGSADQLSKLFTSTEALTPILSIAERGVDGFRRTLEQTADSSGAAAQAFGDVSQSIDFRFAQIEAEVESFRIELAQELLPTIEELIPIFKNDFLPLIQGSAGFFATAARGAAGLVERLRGLVDLGSDDNRQTAFARDFENANKRLEETQRRLDNINRIIAGGISNEDRLAKIEERRLDLVRQRNEQEKQIFLLRQSAEKVGLVEPQTQPGQGLNFTQGPQAPQAKEGEDGESEFSIAQDFLLTEENVEQNASALNRIKQGTLSAFQSIGEEGTTQAEELDKLGQRFEKIGAQARDGFAVGVSSAFAQVGKALANGQNAIDAFGQAFLGVLGQVSQQFGQSLILQGVGISLNPFLGGPAVGGPLIAAGAALSVFGGFLSAAGGAGGASPGVAASDSTSTAFDRDVNDPLVDEDPEERLAQQQVQLVVQGDILDSEDTGRRLLSLLNDNFESESSSFVGASFA